MNLSLATAAELAGLVVASGGILAAIPKGVHALRRLGRVADGILGDGSTDHPGVVAAVEKLADLVKDLVTGQAKQADDVAAVKAQTASIEEKLDRHVDTDSAQWRADGEAWGRRLDSQIAGLDTRVTNLEHGSDTPVS